MTLRQKQVVFARLIGALILEATARGYALRFGEAHRSPEEAARLAKLKKGIAASLHTERLAVDFMLDIGGVWQRSTEAHRPLGEWWEAQSTADYTCCWGGRFGDGNHYSITHAGRK